MEHGSDAEQMSHFNELRAKGEISWINRERGWKAEPEEVVSALINGGFTEYKREVTRTQRDGRATGGVWQGLHTRTGSVASVIWVNYAGTGPAMVFVDVDGEPIEGGKGSEQQRWKEKPWMTGGVRSTTPS